LDAQSITELRAQRFAFLREIYEVASGSTSSNVHQRDIVASLGYDEELADKIGQYLVDEGLLEFFAFGPRYVLTHGGVEEVEAALAAPEQPTRHFPPIVIAQNYIHVGSMVGSAIQQGSHGSTQIVQQPVDVAALRELAADLGAALAAAGAVNGEAAGELAALEALIAAPQPQRAAIRETLCSLRRVVEGALASALASAAPQLPALAERLAHLLATI
jgi:hypothetical protein